MRKIIVLIALSISINSFGYELIISGYVKNNTTQAPIENQVVEIIIDSLSGALYYSLAYTDSDGYYSIHYFLSDSVSGYVNIITDSCNYYLERWNYFSNNSSHITNDFSVCESNPDDCSAYFNYYHVDGQYKIIQFVNHSIGDIDTWQWDFGDGTTSNLENPIHSYQNSGQHFVSLTIEGDSCYDFFQSMVYIPPDTIQNCEAYFFYEQLINQPLTIEFSDLSFGNIENWYWSFGDGNHSYEQDPIHTFTSPGYYMVSLDIVTTDSCNDTYTEEIWVWGDSVSCTANFEYLLDTLNNIPHTFQFFDTSSGQVTSWYWDFGDGNTSNLQDPIHTYENGEQYNVCLTITSQESGTFCVSDTCYTVETFKYFDFGGQVFIGDYPINNDSTDDNNIAVIHLYRKFSNSWFYMDSREFWKYGYYWFANKPAGEYMLFTELYSNSVDYDNYTPTYYPNTPSWKGAGTFNLNSSSQFSVNVYLNELTPLPTGNGIVSGYVIDGISCLNFDTINIDNVLVQLLNQNGKIVAFTYSDEIGFYEFTGIGIGSYDIRAEYPGKYSKSYSINFDQESFIFEQNLEVECNDILDVDMNFKAERARISDPIPNPASSSFNLKSYLPSDQTYNLVIYDVSGDLLLKKDLRFNKGTNSSEINIQSLPPGYYTIHLSSQLNDFNTFKKLIIKN